MCDSLLSLPGLRITSAGLVPPAVWCSWVPSAGSHFSIFRGPFWILGPPGIYTLSSLFIGLKQEHWAGEQDTGTRGLPPVSQDSLLLPALPPVALQLLPPPDVKKLWPPPHSPSPQPPACSPSCRMMTGPLTREGGCKRDTHAPLPGTAEEEERT